MTTTREPIVDGLVFYGVPVLPGSDLHEAIEEVEREICPPPPEVLLALDEPKYEVGTNPQLPLARRLRCPERDPYEHLPESILYFGTAGDKTTRLFFLSDDPRYVPVRHLVQLDDHVMTPKKTKERVDRVQAALDAFGVTQDVGPIGFYCGGQVR